MKYIKLSTPVNIPPLQKTFEYDSIITGIGSCFAQYSMEHLKELGLDTTYNPNGIVYNAVSIAKFLDHILNNKKYDDSNFIKHNNLWHSWEHHGSFSDPDLKTLKKKISESNSIFKNKLANSDLFILTPSSSVVYRLKSTDTIVANCHKYPEKYFNKEVISIVTNLTTLNHCMNIINKINPNCQTIITLSPVRHYPGDLILNGKSKANLLSAIHECIGNFDNIEYFPAYEILIDELRDYRFFNEDMLHPSELARKIILQKFIETYFTTNAQERIAQKEKHLKHELHNPNYG